MRNIKLLIVLFGINALVGCNKFLDVPPTTNVTIPKTLKDYQSLLYPTSMSYGYNAINNLMGDDVYFSKYFYETQPETIVDKRAYLYESEIFDLTITPKTWNDTYSNIFTLNKIIHEVREIKGEPMALVLQTDAEARMYRAYNYFHLVNTFAKPYHLSLEGDLGIPVTDVNDVLEKDRKRTPLKEVYDYILKDLDSAVKYLPNHSAIQSRYLANKMAAYGIKAKVLFYMGQYDQSLREIENVFKILHSGEGSKVELTYRCLDYKTELAYKDPAQPWKGMSATKNFPIAFTTEVKNVESLFTRMAYISDPAKGMMYGVPLNACFVSDMIVTLYNARPGDLRQSYWLFDKTTSGAPWDKNEPGRYLKKHYYSNAGLSYPELILMASECYARKNDLFNALKYLNELRVNRYVANQYTELHSGDKNTVIKWILEERIREFVAQGHRWWDMRRLWEDPIGSQLIVKERVLDGKKYPLTKERLTLRIPEYIMQFHPDWKQND